MATVKANWIGFYKAHVMSRTAAEIQTARDNVLTDPGERFNAYGLTTLERWEAYGHALDVLARTGQHTYPPPIPEK